MRGEGSDQNIKIMTVMMSWEVGLGLGWLGTGRNLSPCWEVRRLRVLGCSAHSLDWRSRENLQVELETRGHFQSQTGKLLRPVVAFLSWVKTSSGFKMAYALNLTSGTGEDGPISKSYLLF